MPEGDAAAFECSSGATPSTPPLEFDETVTSDEVSDPKSTARTRVTCFVFFLPQKMSNCVSLAPASNQI